MINIKAAARMGRWQWAVSLLLLSATMINYMDRQTLANLSIRIKDQFELSNQQYGNLEQAFSISFAVGSLLWGVLADVMPVRILYPFVLIAWSLVGFATGLSNGYESLFYCRAALGFFESGHWPCALVVTHSILTSTQRPLANSILQSGASVGAIITPIVILMMVPAVAAGDMMQADAWRPPFLIIGAVGLLWVLAWFLIVKRNSIHQVSQMVESTRPTNVAMFLAQLMLNRKFWALVLMVVSINITWQMIRAWLPMFLQKGRGYSESVSLSFMSAYYLCTDIGCLLAGAGAARLAHRGLSAHSSRLIAYAVCALVTCLTVLASRLDAGIGLLAILLCVGAGSLGLFPCYYSFTQEIDARRVGKVTGILSFLGWILTAPVHPFFGKMVDETGAWSIGLACVGCVPLIGLFAMLILWPTQPDEVETEVVTTEDPKTGGTERLIATNSEMHPHKPPRGGR